MTRLRPHLAVFGLYLLVAGVITWPLVMVLATRFAGFGYGDSYEMAHHLWWFKHALQTGQPLFYQSMLGYPAGFEGISLWADPLQFFPAWLLAFVLPLASAYNLTLLLTMALNGWALWFLARHLTGRFGPALLAGLVFMAYPTMQGHLGAGHAGLLVQWPLPLYVYALFRLRETATRRWIVLGALWFVMSAFGHTLQLIYTLLPITAVFALALLWRRDWRALARVIAAAVIGGVALGLFLLPVLATTLSTDAYAAEGSVRYSADLLALATPSFFHPIFGGFDYTHRVLGTNIDEGYAYVGIVALLLAIIAVWKTRAARWWLLLAALAWLPSLGPLLKILDQPVRLSVGGYETFITLPGALLERLPLLNLARTPGRFNFTVALAVAVMVGYGAAFLWPRLRRLNWPLLVAAAALILFEFQAFWPLPTIPATVPDAIAALRGRGDVRAVLDAPWGNLVAAKEGLFLQTVHERPLIAGHVTRQTPVSPARLTLLETTFDPALLDLAGADVVIIHREYDPQNELFDRAREQLGDPTYEDERFALFETPDTDDPPTFAAELPAAGSLEDSADLYAYTSDAGWALLTATLNANGRDVALRLNGETLQRWTIDGEQAIRVPVPLAEPGYHTLTLAVEPPCPQVYSVALRCRAVNIDNLILEPIIPQALTTAFFEPGVQLTGAYLPERDGIRLDVWLWWQFHEARSETDIRFVHVIDANGDLAAQFDATLGHRASGEQLTEIVTVDLPADLPPGEYRVYTGWYTFPDAVRFPVISDVQGRENGYVYVGAFTVEE